VTVNSADRVARNELLFSVVNDRVAHIVDTFGESPQAIQFVCECAFLDCTDAIELTPDQYRALRARDNCFAVKRGHELGPDIETVIGEHGDVLIVHKLVEPGPA
jgi:hypothetical protein